MRNTKSTFFILLIVILGFTALSFFGAGPIKGSTQIRYGIDIRGGVEAVFSPKELQRPPTSAELEQARTVIESRLDAKSILDREVTIDKENGGVIVRFPWKSDEAEFNPQKAISELGEMARLTFRDEDGKVLVEGKDVASSSAAMEPTSSSATMTPIVKLSFNAEGAQLFADATGRLVGKRIAIYMDETLISAPTVNQKIEGGEAIIDGMENMNAARDLSRKINSGSLPFSLETKNYSSISPTLGNGALNIMIIAGFLAFILICIFMLLKYRLPGFISCIALTLQLAGQLLFISIPQITLTLSGIAGIILSLGMGVDANIIISERIREELRHGATLRAAVRNGYKNAFSSVFDGNVTTAIVAVILMIFGSGTMFSFGYTLLAGIILNFVAGVFASKAMLTSMIQYKPMQNPKLYNYGEDKKTLPFYKKRFITYGISIFLMLAGVFGCFINGISLDTQFKGGTVLKYTFSGEVDVNQLSSVATDVLNRPSNVQIATDFANSEKRLVLTLAGNNGITPDQHEALEEKLRESFSSSNMKLSESYMVEPYMGQRSLNNSIIAIVLSFIMIIAYVWIRFRNISGLSAGIMALVALFHDVFIAFFAFVLMRIPLNDPFVAVVLTIIGFSINDTIVVYDRIRENRKQFPKMGVIELVDTSITQSITRSINTSFTTAISCVLMMIFSIFYGIDSIKLFAMPMTIGLISGCYSTICIAGPLWVSWQLLKAKRKEHRLKISD